MQVCAPGEGKKVWKTVEPSVDCVNAYIWDTVIVIVAECTSGFRS